MKDALRDKIDELLLVQRGKDLNISVDSDAGREIARLQVQSRLSDSDKFAEWIRSQYGVSLEEYKQKLKDSLMAQRVVSGRGRPADLDLRRRPEKPTTRSIRTTSFARSRSS